MPLIAPRLAALSTRTAFGAPVSDPCRAISEGRTDKNGSGVSVHPSLVVALASGSEGSRGGDTYCGFLILRMTFHAQPKLSKIPSNMSLVKLPVRCRKPIVAPTPPSFRTVPLMFATSPSNLA